jgi:hypothetical protein
MNGGNNGTAIQSFRAASATNTANTLENEEKNTLLPPPPTDSRHRIWINMEENPLNGSSPLRQLLIGYVACSTSGPYSECATAGETDRIFDSKTVPSINPRIEFYSISNAPANPLLPLHLAIQGRKLADYTDSDFFQLDYIAPVGGTYTFTTSSDGMFTTKKYYVLDAMASDPLLRNPFPYTFTTSATDVPKRFKVVFESPTSVVTACGTQISDIWTSVFCNQLPNVSVYFYKVRRANGTIVGVFTGAGVPWNFNMNHVGIEFNTEYWVSVATYQVAGLGWVYGPECKITTPTSPPQTTISFPACGSIISNTGDAIRSNQMSNIFDIMPTQYRFNAVVGGTNYVYTAPLATLTNPNNRCTLRSNFRDGANNAMPVTINTTYVMSVDVLWNGAWIIGTTTCTFTTANVITRPSHLQTNEEEFDATIYPNPFATNFKLDITPSSDSTIGVKVYDMVGRLIEERQVLITEINSQEVGDKYPTGVYTIVITQGENLKTLRVIKR